MMHYAVSTKPLNAIVNESKRISVIQMTKTGFMQNFLGIVVVSPITTYLSTFIFDIADHSFAEWAFIAD